jgi:hypothetical protein
MGTLAMFAMITGKSVMMEGETGFDGNANGPCVGALL